MKIHLFSAALILTITLVLANTLLSLENIKCQVKKDPCPSELVTSLNQDFRGQRLIFNKLKPKLETHPALFGRYLVKKVQKTWPQTLAITLEPDKIVYQVQTEDGVFALSQSQVANKLKKPNPDLLLITEAPADPKELVLKNRKLHQALTQLANELEMVGLKGGRLNLGELNLAELEFEQKKLLVLVDLNKPRPLAGLAAVLSSQEFNKLSSTNKDVVVDLRFKLPVLSLR